MRKTPRLGAGSFRVRSSIIPNLFASEYVMNRNTWNRQRYVWQLGWCCVVVPAVGDAQTIAHAPLQSGTLTFSAHATVGDFTGTTTTMSGDYTGDVTGARGWVEAPVATLVTGNGHRDRDMRASLEAERYPTMRFDLTRTAVIATAAHDGDSSAVMLYGTLSIHGAARSVVLPATVVRDGDTTRLRSTFPLDLEDYRIGGLRKMMGLLRMDPKILVQVDLRFVSAPSLDATASRP